jgi:hypothetical protein
MRLNFAFLTPFAILGAAIALNTPGKAQPERQGPVIRLGPNSETYYMQVSGSEKTEDVRIRVAPEVRRAVIRFSTLPPENASENRLVGVELFETDPTGSILQRVTAGTLVQVRDLQRNPDVYRVLWFLPGLSVPRKEKVDWLLRFHSLPIAAGREPLPVQVGIEIHSDATPLTERERALIAWREGIKNPEVQVDLVRAKVAELTDEEVRLYTAFDSRELFLKYWMTTRKADLLDAGGKIAPAHRAGYRGLTNPGKPLPSGKYLHHNGTVPPLPD